MNSRGNSGAWGGRLLLTSLTALLTLSFVFTTGRNASAQVNDPTNTLGRTASGPPRVVVADIDSGINVYHSFFNAGGEGYKTAAPSSVTPEVLAAFGIDAAHQIELTRTGNFADRKSTRLNSRHT